MSELPINPSHRAKSAEMAAELVAYTILEAKEPRLALFSAAGIILQAQAWGTPDALDQVIGLVKGSEGIL